MANISTYSFDRLENMKINCNRTIKRIISTLKTLGKKPELSICAASADKLEKLIFLYSLIAVKIMEITYTAREYPEADCEKVFEPDEWELLYKIANKAKKIPEMKPSVKEIVGFEYTVLPVFFFAPYLEVEVYRLPIRKITWQHSPLYSAFSHIQHRTEHVI